uniref:Uncharacterized protein n=1 Tax=Moniliophthora roreri TaxID=221103 RepID=A0A0W0GEM8_MONRR
MPYCVTIATACVPSSLTELLMPHPHTSYCFIFRDHSLGGEFTFFIVLVENHGFFSVFQRLTISDDEVAPQLKHPKFDAETREWLINQLKPGSELLAMEAVAKLPPPRPSMYRIGGEIGSVHSRSDVASQDTKLDVQGLAVGENSEKEEGAEIVDRGEIVG